MLQSGCKGNSHVWHTDPYPADGDIQYTWRGSGLNHMAAHAFVPHDCGYRNTSLLNILKTVEDR